MRTASLAALVAVAALALMLVARDGTGRRAPDRAAAIDASGEAAPTRSEPEARPVSVRGLVRADGRPVAGVDVVVYRVPDLQQIRFPVNGRPSNNNHVIEEMPTDVVARAATDAEGRFVCEVPRGAACAAVVAGRLRCFEADQDEIELLFDLKERRDVRVTFVDPDGRPVEGARVFAYDGSSIYPPVAELRTDAAGAVAVAAGDGAELVASAPKLATTRVELGYADDETPFAPALDDQCVEMAWARRIAGHVRDSDGRPLAGAAVDVRGGSGRGDLWDFPPPWWRRVTAADGSFAFEALGGDASYAVHVTKPGYVAEYIRIWPDDPAAAFVLRRTGSVSGIVVFADGTPAGNATVRTNRGNPVKTGADGTFRFPAVPPGRCPLRANVTRDDRWTHSSGAFAVDVPEGGHIDTVRLVLAEVVRSEVRYRVAGDEKTKVASRDVPPGTTVALHVGGRPRQAQPGPLRAKRAAVTVEVGSDDAPLTFTLPEPVDVTLALVDENGALIALTPDAKVLSDGWLVRTRAGHVDLAANPETPLVAEIEVEGFIGARVEHPPPKGGTIEVVLRHARCEVTGRIVTATGEPYQGHVGVQGDGHANGYTDADGRFLLRGLGPGPATLYAEVWRTVELAPGRTDVGTIAIPGAVRVRGTVVDAEGHPVWQAEVRLHDRRTGESGARDPLMWTRGDGSFDVTVTPTSDYALRIEKDGFATAFAPLAPAPRIVLRPGGTIVVHVSEEEAKRSSSVGVRNAAGRWRPRSTSRDGRREWTLSGVPAGDWEVFLWRRGESVDTRATCTVVAGGTSVVRFD